jgi:hypothetical protein
MLLRDTYYLKVIFSIYLPCINNNRRQDRQIGINKSIIGIFDDI